MARDLRFGLVLVVLAIGLIVSACGRASASPAGSGATIVAVGAENEYANVISQIGGRYVKVSAIESNPNTDPHTFEASPTVAQEVSQSRLIVQNGLGYDDYMNKIEGASPSSSRKVISVQKILGLPDSTPNPHLWYDPATMPALVRVLAKDLSAIQPEHARYFQAKADAFDASLKPWLNALGTFKRAYPNTPVATSEPVGNDMLRAAGTTIMTPFTLQAAIMNGTDPAPQNVTLQNDLFSQHRVKVFVYNQQVTDSLTQSFRKLAAASGVPVVGVYETMPTGYSYQSWMLAEVNALRRAVSDRASTERLSR